MKNKIAAILVLSSVFGLNACDRATMREMEKDASSYTRGEYYKEAQNEARKNAEKISETISRDGLDKQTTSTFIITTLENSYRDGELMEKLFKETGIAKDHDITLVKPGTILFGGKKPIIPADGIEISETRPEGKSLIILLKGYDKPVETVVHPIAESITADFAKCVKANRLSSEKTLNCAMSTFQNKMLNNTESEIVNALSKQLGTGYVVESVRTGEFRKARNPAAASCIQIKETATNTVFKILLNGGGFFLNYEYN